MAQQELTVLGLYVAGGALEIAIRYDDVTKVANRLRWSNTTSIHYHVFMQRGAVSRAIDMPSGGGRTETLGAGLLGLSDRIDGSDVSLVWDGVVQLSIVN